MLCFCGKVSGHVWLNVESLENLASVGAYWDLQIWCAKDEIIACDIISEYGN